MREISERTFIDDHGRLFLELDETPDPFDAPGAPVKTKIVSTDCVYLDVPIYGWPLGVVYKNNPLQFANPITAERTASRIASILGPLYKVSLYTEEVKVGPFAWRDKWMIRVSGNGGTADLNAGLEASTYERYSATYEADVRTRIRRAA